MSESLINSYYKTHDKTKIRQGDILKDLKFQILIDELQVLIEFPYVVVLSQACDLNENHDKLDSVIVDCDYSFEKVMERKTSINCKPFLPNILFCPAFGIEEIKAGSHLKDLYNILQQEDNGRFINSNKFNSIKTNKDVRFHFLNHETQENISMPDLVIDFKIYYTLSYYYFRKLHNKYYKTSLNELFRESLSQRFANYLNRIGLPVIEN